MQPVAFKVAAGTGANVCFANPARCEECHGVWIFFVVVFGLLMLFLVCLVRSNEQVISEAFVVLGKSDVTLLVVVVFFHLNRWKPREKIL